MQTPSLSPSARDWVESTLRSMTLREKAAQTVMVRAHGIYRNPRSEAARRLRQEVEELGVGGVVVFVSHVGALPHLLNELQDAAAVPLLVAADMERGLAQRVAHGVVPLPYPMAVGATRLEEAAEITGEITAREARAVGIHWALAPVADVNSDPANPVINLRSYGESPELVGRMAAAFVRGARRGGLLTAAKHFPGHGDTDTDSHRALPVIAADRTRLATIEWPPFHAAIAAGVDGVMLGHIAVPMLDPSGAPASLSPALAGELLRGEFGFDGLLVTDALEMRGLRSGWTDEEAPAAARHAGPETVENAALRSAWTGEAAVRAVAAGVDVLLLPRDSRVAVQSLVRAVAEGQLTEVRLDASVRRILETKARLGLHENRRVEPEVLGEAVGRPGDVDRARGIASRAITLVRDDGGVLPLAAERPLRLLHLVLTDRLAGPRGRVVLEEELDERRIPQTVRRYGPEIGEATTDEVVATAATHSHVVVSSFVGVSPEPQRPALSSAQVRLLRRLLELDPPVVFVSFRSPYLLREVPELDAYLCAYGGVESSQRAAVAALFGEAPVSGRLPVTIPDLHPFGHGLERPRREMTLRRAEVDEDAERWRPVDRIVEDFIARRAFPGAVLAVGHRGRLVQLEAYGRLTYDDGAAAVTVDTLYDLASLTKVVATTTATMILADEERLHLDEPVRDFLPRFRGPGTEAVSVRHLLTHSSGLDWWAPLYEELRGWDAYVERIEAMELVYEPGSKSLYSDLGVILLGEIVERAAGEPFEAFVRRRILEPLAREETTFRPPPALHQRIAPTEHDPWRGRLLRGEVHDENAFAMGGVAPHAGLFSTAPELARFAQMILWGGVFEHRRIAARETVERFTRRAGVPGSTRALGWDTKSAEGSSAGELFSASSFGHTGYTGTSLWIDPERELFVVLLTNRVHPSRENVLIREARPTIHDAVVRAVEAP